MIDIKRLCELENQFLKKADQAELNYQTIGSGSYYKTFLKYKELVEIVQLAKSQVNGNCDACERHRRRINETVNRYKKYNEQGDKSNENYESFISELYSLLF